MSETPGRGAVGLRVLVLSPPLSRSGGVAQYVRVTREHAGCRTEYAFRGSREAEGGRPRLLRMVRDYTHVARRLLRGAPDVVHQNTSFGAHGLLRDAIFVLMAKLRGACLLVFFHGWDERLEARMTGARLLLFRAVYFRADAMVVLAERYRDRLRNWGYGGTVHLETTVVEDALPGAAARAADAAPRRDGLRVLYLARVERAKGIYETLDACSRLGAAGTTVHLAVAGDGSELEAAKRYATAAGVNAEFLGHVTGEGKAAAFAGADLYLLASHREGMPTSVLEAMACGLPVVATAVGGLVDFFEDGRMGFLVPPGDGVALTDAVSRLAADPALRARMSTYNREYAAARFMASRVVRRLDHIYEAVAGAR